MNYQTFIRVSMLVIALIGITHVVAQNVLPTTIQATMESLYPEGIDYDIETDQFIVGSLYYGGVFTVNGTGGVSQLIDDERLVSTVGVYTDTTNRRLLVANSDPGVGLRTNAETQFKLAGLGIYDLDSGEPIHYVDLGIFSPGLNHFANDIAIDEQGTAYVTDSFAPIIYRVTADGEASVFLQDERLSGTGFALNGIVYHPDGYLLVAKSDDGSLFRIPVDNPTAFSRISIDGDVVGVDGLELLEDNQLMIVTNVLGGGSSNTVQLLSSSDDWQTAVQTDMFLLPFPATTAARATNAVFIVRGRLENLFNPDFDGTDTEFDIVPIPWSQRES
jgi:hypothetical protein